MEVERRGVGEIALGLMNGWHMVQMYGFHISLKLSSYPDMRSEILFKLIL